MSELTDLSAAVNHLTRTLERSSKIGGADKKIVDSFLDVGDDITDSYEKAAAMYAAALKSGKDFQNKNVNELKQSNDFLKQLLNDSSKGLKTEIGNANSIKKLDALPKAFKDVMTNNVFNDSSFVQSLTGSFDKIETLGDFLKAQSALSGFNELPRQLAAYSEALQNVTDDIDAEIEINAKFNETLNSFGLSIGQLNGLIDNEIKASGGVIDRFEALSIIGEKTRNEQIAAAQALGLLHTNVKKSNEALEKQAEAIQSLKDFWKPNGWFMATAISFGANLYDTAKEAARFGSTIQWTTDSLRTGLSQKELIQLQGEYRQSLMALGEGFEGHTKLLTEGMDELLLHIGSAEGVSRANAQFLDLAQTIGQTRDKKTLLGIVAAQRAGFAELNNTLGMTIEQFNDFNLQMLQNADAYALMYRMGPEEARKYAMGMDEQLLHLTTVIGMTAESAKKTMQTFQSLGSKSARERLEKAAKAMATAGALGMGQQGRVLFESIRTGRIESPEFVNALDDLQARLKEQTEQPGYMGGPAEFKQQALLESTNMNDLLGENGSMVQKTVEVGKKIDAAAVENKKVIDGLARTGSENLDKLWKNLQPEIAMTESLLKTLNLTLVTGFLGLSKAIGILSASLNMSRATGAAGDAIEAGAAGMGKYGGKAADWLSKKPGGGKLLGFGRSVMGGLKFLGGPLVGLLVGVAATALADQDKIKEAFKTGERAKAIGNTFVKGMTLGFVDNVFGPLSQEMLNDPDKFMPDIRKDINSKLATVAPETNFRARTDEAISKMTEEQLKRENEQIDLLKKQLEEKSKGDESLLVAVKELTAYQKHQNEISSKSLEEQKATRKEARDARANKSAEVAERNRHYRLAALSGSNLVQVKQPNG